MPITDKCKECDRLKADVAYARKSYLEQQTVNRSFASRGKQGRDALRRLELAREKAEAVYRVHLGADHKDEGHSLKTSDIVIVMRGGRKGP